MGKRRKNGDGSIIRTDDGTYIARMVQGVKANGKPYVKSRRAKSKAEAQRKLQEIKDEFEQEAQFGSIAFREQTVSQFFDDYLQYKRVTLSDTSYRRLESTVDQHIKQYLGNYKFIELNYQVIQKRLDDAHQEGLSYSSVKKIYDALNGCFKFAIASGNIKPHANPMLAVNMIAQNKFDKKNTGPRYLKNDELDNERERFINEALRKYKNGKYVYRYGPAMIFMLNTGLRESEMSALSYETIHLEEKYFEVKDSAAMVKIDGHYQLVVRNNETKWNSGRYVPLNDRALEMLTEMARMFHGDGYVITTVNGTVLPPLELTKTFKRICKAANITENMDGVGAHCLRHTFATSLFEQGVDVKVISELLGHSSIGVTLNTYVSVANKMKIQAVSLPQI